MRLGRQVDVRARAAGFPLDELEVLSEDLFSESFHIDRLAHRLFHPACRLLHLFVLQDEILLNLVHHRAVTLNRIKLFIRASLRDLVEDLQDLLVLIFHVNEAKFLPLIFANEWF